MPQRKQVIVDETKTVTVDQLKAVMDSAPDFPDQTGSAEHFLANDVADFVDAYVAFWNKLSDLISSPT